MNWQEMAFTSHYQTALAVEKLIIENNTSEAAAGIRELIESLGRSEKRSLKSQLIRLMVHIVKWKTQPERRSRSWVASICNARDEIRDIQEETPSLTDHVIREMWNKCLRSAIREAEGEMNRKTDVNELSWGDVFEAEYELD